MAGPWITEHEIKVVEDCMRNGWYNYDYVEKFQAEFAAYHGRKFGIMTPNCTHAIHLLLTAMGVGDGDEVILPECTWIASGAGVTYLRAKPVFCDIDPVHWCIDPDSAERAITPRTLTVIAGLLSATSGVFWLGLFASGRVRLPRRWRAGESSAKTETLPVAGDL